MLSKRLIGSVGVAGALASIPVRAHCPRCTIGAAAAAGGAVWLGVDKAVVGLFIGAFAASMGWWVANLIKRSFVPFQRTLLVVSSFLSTVLPLLPLFKKPVPILLTYGGDYGSILNRTYVVDGFLIASVLGLAIVAAAPWISRRLTALRQGRMLPYQGIALTFILLIIAGAALQWGA